jgi:asparagine synthase (glutamine-hydrolysing)
MCGIVMLYRAGGKALIAPMLERIRHRGPDDSGAEELGEITIGARRLAIIDVPGGHQPLANEDDTVWVAFNGEIYNHAELRQELLAERHRFRAATDTEVLVHGYEAWGIEGLLARLRGMFAFALVDTRTRTCFVARDRLGEKPVYLARAGAGWAAASEIKSLFAHPSIAPALDEDRIPESLANRFVTGTRTAFANVTKLLPGHFLRLSGTEAEVRCYWEPPVADGRPIPANMEEEVRNRVDESVRMRLVSDVPLGALLSGGLDSSIVVAAMRHAGANPLRTYTVGFEHAASDERSAAARVARHLQTEHTERVVALDATTLVDDVVWHLDEPLGDAAALPTLLICRSAREHVKVVLSGEGADELFLGYPRYILSRLADRALTLPTSLRSGLFGLAARIFPGRAGAALGKLAGAPDDALVRNALWQSGADPRAIAALCRRSAINWERWYVPAAVRAPEGAKGLGAVLRRDLTAWLVDDILLKLDKMSMAASLEARAPFLDHELVEFICRLPLEARYAARGKQWLRGAYHGALPAEALARRKRPFRPPVAEWFRGQLGLSLEAMIGRPGSFTARYLDRATAQGLLDAHRRGADHALLLWSLLVHETWWQRFFSSPADAA